MRSYGQYCPMTKAVEILGERWTLLIVRELLLGVHRFNDLERRLPGISRALLTQRLRQLERSGVVERRVASNGRATAYHLTSAGRELQHLVDVLVAWGARWAFGEPETADLDPVLLLWWMRDRIHHACLPPRQVVVQFDFRGARTRTLWLVLDRGDVSVCLRHPGFEIDVLVTADIAALYRVWLGRSTLAEAMRSYLVQLDGPPALVRAFPGWFAWSPVADVVRAAVAAPLPWQGSRFGSDQEPPGFAIIPSWSNVVAGRPQRAVPPTSSGGDGDDDHQYPRCGAAAP